MNLTDNLLRCERLKECCIFNVVFSMLYFQTNITKKYCVLGFVVKKPFASEFSLEYKNFQLNHPNIVETNYRLPRL